MKIVMIIGMGGFLGAVSRYGISHFFLKHFEGIFPLGTFVINIVGCLLIGLFYALSERSELVGYEWRLFLTVGFCGAFTTFSTFANENLFLLRNGHFWMFALYAVVSLFLGICAVWIGHSIVKLF